MTDKILATKEGPLFCYKKVPDDQSIEMKTVFNACLKIANDFVDFAYEINKTRFPKIAKPEIYLCLLENDIKRINAFTDGKDIYLYAAIFLGMNDYIDERLDTINPDGSSIFAKGLETDSKLKIQQYLIEIIVAHELIHIWHNHMVWRIKYLPIENTKLSTLEEVNLINDDYSSVDFPELQTELFNILYPNQNNLIQQVLEMDSDCGAINLVMQRLFNEIAPHIREAETFEGQDKDKRIKSTVWYQRNMIGFIIAAAGLMCGFFDRKLYSGDYFRSLQFLNSGTHPLPSIRFYKMKLTINTVLFHMYQDEGIVDDLLEDEFTFRNTIFSHNQSGEKSDLNCFWTPVFTQVAQEHVVKLEKGWNTIRDSIEKVAFFAVAPSYSEESLAIPEENIIFDSNGEWIN